MWGLAKPGHLQPNDCNGGVSRKCHPTVTAWHHCSFPSGRFFISQWPPRTQLTVLMHRVACTCTQHQGSSTRLYMTRLSLGCSSEREVVSPLLTAGAWKTRASYSWVCSAHTNVLPSLPLCHFPLFFLLPVYGPLGKRLETCTQNRGIFYEKLQLILFLEHNT